MWTSTLSDNEVRIGYARHNEYAAVHIILGDGSEHPYQTVTAPKHRLTRKLVHTEGTRYFDFFGFLVRVGAWRVHAIGNRGMVMDNGELWEDGDE